MRWQVVKSGCIVLGVALVIATGCARKIVPEKPGTVHRSGDLVARVNGQELRWDDMDRRAQNALHEEVAAKKLFVPAERQEEALQFFRRQAVQVFVNKTLLLAEAKRLGIHPTDEDRKMTMGQIEPLLKTRGFKSFDDFLAHSPLGEKATRREFEDGLFVDKFLNQEIRSKIVVSDADRDAFAQEVATLRHAAKRKADEVRLQLLKGIVDFPSLIHQNSETQIAGELGDITRGRLEKTLENTVFNLKVNELTPVTELPVGFDILKVTGRTAPKAATATSPAVPESVHAVHVLFRAPPLLTAKTLDNAIRTRKYETSFKGVLKDLQSKAKIETIYSDMVF